VTAEPDFDDLSSLYRNPRSPEPIPDDDGTEAVPREARKLYPSHQRAGADVDDYEVEVTDADVARAERDIEAEKAERDKKIDAEIQKKFDELEDDDADDAEEADADDAEADAEEDADAATHWSTRSLAKA
jgi:hypothetical protein